VGTKDYFAFSLKDLHLCTGFVQTEVASNGGRNSNKTSTLHGDESGCFSHNSIVASIRLYCIAELMNLEATE
jgi:hypothetical protein